VGGPAAAAKRWLTGKTIPGALKPVTGIAGRAAVLTVARSGPAAALAGPGVAIPAQPSTAQAAAAATSLFRMLLMVFRVLLMP
jgi:hypothetical protein